MNDLLQQYYKCLKSGNASKLAAFFTEDAVFHDEAPVKIGMEPIHIEGRDAIEEMFTMILANGGLQIENIAINRNAMRYDVVMGDIRVLALGVIVKETNGLIKEYSVVSA